MPWRKATSNRLLKKGHLLRFPAASPSRRRGRESLLIRRDATPHPSSLRRTAKYASLLRISGALHLALFEQPGKDYFFSSLLKIFPRVGNLAFNGRSSCDSRRPQVDERFWAAHPSLEIPGLGGQTDFPIPKNTFMKTHTSTATRRCDHSPRINKSFHGSIF